MNLHSTPLGQFSKSHSSPFSDEEMGTVMSGTPPVWPSPSALHTALPTLHFLGLPLKELQGVCAFSALCVLSGVCFSLSG